MVLTLRQHRSKQRNMTRNRGCRPWIVILVLLIVTWNILGTTIIDTMIDINITISVDGFSTTCSSVHRPMTNHVGRHTNVFSLMFPSSSLQSLTTSTSLWMGGAPSSIGRKNNKKKKKKNKPSMAERLKRRQNKARGASEDGGPHVSPFAGLPRTVLDSQKPRSIVGGGDDNSENDNDTKNRSSDDPIHVENPSAAANKAKELLLAQRKSVDMLTLIKDRIVEQLSPSSVLDDLESRGYAVVDNFLNDEAIMEELDTEVERMMHTDDNNDKDNNNIDNDEASISSSMMEVDSSNLGSGEYVTSIKGGNEQYNVCPRIVEFVVSSTKNVPEIFNGNNTGGPVPPLDPSACMATLRCFDRRTFKASLALLTGSEDDSIVDETQRKAPFDVISNDNNGINVGEAVDRRRLSIFYFLVPESWNSQHDENHSDGGGFVFESGTQVYAKRDRLLIILSNTTRCKKIPWKGNDGQATKVASAIELHLLEI